MEIRSLPGSMTEEQCQLQAETLIHTVRHGATILMVISPCCLIIARYTIIPGFCHEKIVNILTER